MAVRAAAPGVGAGLALVALLGAVGCGSSSRSTPKASAPVPTISVTTPSAVSTPLPRGVLTSIALDAGSAPGSMVAGAGAIWVSAHRGNTLYRVNPAGDRIAARIDLGQPTCGIPAYGAGRVFVTPCDGSLDTMVVDATTNQVVGQIGKTAPGGGLWFAFGSVWATTNDLRRVVRVDPVTLKRLAVIPIPSLDFVDDARSMWFAETDTSSTYTGHLDQLDPATNRVVRRLHTATSRMGGDPFLAYAGSSLWLKSDDGPTLTRIVTSSGKVSAYDLPGWAPLSQYYDQPVIVDSGTLWMRIADDKVVSFDPRLGRVTATYPADPRGGGGYPLVAFGSLWVANFATNTVWRERLER